ncbi:unnamed protein product [Merluccius merluccius]
MSPSVVSLVSRLAVSMRTCRFASRDAKAWPRPGLMQRVPGGRRPAQDHQHHKVLDEDVAVEEVEDKLDALLSQEKKRKAAVKMSRIKRQMTPPGAPERTLSWDTIEQIRYLRRERPEEWTLERLAEGFSVPHDDILRVLKSKFSPTGPRKVKQDAKVMARLGQRTAQLPAGGVPQSTLLLPAQKTPAMLVAVDDASVTGPASLVTRPNLLPLSTATVEVSRPTPATSISEEDDCGAPPVESGGDDVEEERWDGEVLTESELEELMLTTKPSAAVSVGKDFYDPEGNFLYRI